MTTRMDKQAAYFLIKNKHKYTKLFMDEGRDRHQGLLPLNALGFRTSKDEKYILVKVSGGHEFWRNNLTQSTQMYKKCIVRIFDKQDVPELKTLMTTENWVKTLEGNE